MFGALISKVARLIDSRNPQAKAFKANMDELKVRVCVCDAWFYVLSRGSFDRVRRDELLR